MSATADLLDDEAITSLNDELHDILDDMHASGLQDCSKESIRVRNRVYGCTPVAYWRTYRLDAGVSGLSHRG